MLYTTLYTFLSYFIFAINYTMEEADNLEVRWIKHPAPNHAAYVLGNIQSHNFCLLVLLTMTHTISHIIKYKKATQF